MSNIDNIKDTKYIFITGGVVSSLGKGLTGASLASILQARGFSVAMQKLDPYLNVDPGTMSPLQHGEVYVTNDGAETDLDLGHYERFTGVKCTKNSNYTSGRIYQGIIRKERRGDYLGATVQVVPHVTDAIKDAIRTNHGKADFALIEIGGTVGEIESQSFFEAIRQYAYEVGREKCLFMHLTLVPYLKAAGEIKTKPTQHSIKELLKSGIQADIVVCRSEMPIGETELSKIALFGNIPMKNVISCPDSDTIYRVPSVLHAQGLDNAVLDYFRMDINKIPAPDLSDWDKCADNYKNPEQKVKIAVVGKYVSLADAYKSVNEALIHGGLTHNIGVDIQFCDSEALENYSDEEMASVFSETQGILVPGGFGTRGTEGKIKAITYARQNNIPYFGICLGMQLAVVEFARSIAGISGAGSTEFNEVFGEPQDAVIGLMTEWETDGGNKTKRSHNGDLGGTMRLGAYPCKLVSGTKAFEAYKYGEISERHRHRYEFNINYKKRLEEAGLIFSGMSPDGQLTEIVELPESMHRWFVAGQFHPEFNSEPRNPHPLFSSFIKEASKVGVLDLDMENVSQASEKVESEVIKLEVA